MIKEKLKKIKKLLVKLYLKIFEEPKLEIKNCDEKPRAINNSEIPLICYQTWEEKKFYKSHAIGLNKFRKVNPEIKFEIYDANDRDDFMRKEWGKHNIYKIYLNANFKVMQADIFRYCILYSYGGFYCDISIAPKEKLISFLEKEIDCGFMVGEWDPKILINSIAEPLLSRGVHPSYIYNGFIVSRKSSIFMEDLILKIEERYKSYINVEKEDPRSEIIMNTGPGLVTELFSKNIHKYENVKLFPVKYSRNECTVEGSNLRHYTFKSYMDRKNEKLFLDKP